MGAGASAQTVQDHLDKQEVLIKRLQQAVEKQGAAIDAKFEDGEPARADFDPADLEEEIHGLYATIMRMQSEPSKPDPAIYPDEAETADAEPGEPTKDAVDGKPWLAAMAPPSGFVKPADADSKPPVRLELEYIYGCPRSRHGRNAIALRDDDHVVHYAGAVGIVHEISSNTQVFAQGHSGQNEGHSDDILCLAYHAPSQTVATGQLGKGLQACICVWSAKTGEQKAKLAGFHTRAVVAVAFNNAGTHLSSCGLDDANSVAVHDWACGQKVAAAATGKNRVMAVRYEPGSDSDFVIVGVDTISFWTRNGEDLICQHAKLGKVGRMQPFMAVGFSGGNTVVGTALGELYLLGPSRCLVKVIDAHNGAVACITELGNDIATGGKDGFVSVWDTSLRRLRQYNMSKDTALKNRVRSLAVHGETLVASCVNSTIYRLSQKAGVEAIIDSHHGDLNAEEQYGELWGLAPDPKGGRFATVCDDATLRVWDTATHTCVSKIDIGATSAGGPARSLVWSPDGAYIVCGFLQGSIAIFNAETLQEDLRIKKRKRRIQCMAFSPCSKYLAAGSADNTVDIYDAGDDFRRVCILKGNQSVVMQVDWSEDSKLLKTASQGYDLLYFDFASDEVKSGLVPPLPLEKAKELKDVKWASTNGYLGWDVQGIWPSRDFGGGEVNAVRRSNDGKTLATADTYGRIKLFRYPCVGGGFDKDGMLTRRPHCQWVAPSPSATNVEFSSDDRHVFSTGGGDLSVFQWRVVPDQ
eukprot:TRINITY_DN7252_c0_g1_i1.p1 TRINITY_DN7252_c0_g1~~TRINITY_DN7252_c0_g1_i1.p1  ORF type:complete len:776 (+),score=326.70 TRINITY_DN7252_c0_g1_i1:74-2329(+)